MAHKAPVQLGVVKKKLNVPLVDELVITEPWRRRFETVVSGRVAISVDEAAVLLGVGRATAFKAAKAGSLPTFRVGRRLLVGVGWIEAQIASAREGVK